MWPTLLLYDFTTRSAGPWNKAFSSAGRFPSFIILYLPHKEQTNMLYWVMLLLLGLLTLQGSFLHLLLSDWWSFMKAALVGHSFTCFQMLLAAHAGDWRMASAWHCDESCLSHWGWRIDYLCLKVDAVPRIYQRSEWLLLAVLECCKTPEFTISLLPSAFISV